MKTEPGHRPIRCGEAGDTLIELLVTVVLMGLAVVGIIGGIAEAAQLSTLHRSQADVSAALTSASEYLKAQAYEPCTGAINTLSQYNLDLTSGFADYVSGLAALGIGGSASGQVESDVPNPTVKSVTDTSGDACAGTNDPGTEVIQLQATSINGRVTQTVYLIKAGNR